LAGIGVEECDEGETLGAEAGVAGEGTADVADADEERVGDAIGAEDLAESCDERGDLVADAGAAELAEVGEVLADLCVGEAEGACEGAGGDGGDGLGVEGFELAQVEAESADSGMWDIAAQCHAWHDTWGEAGEQAGRMRGVGCEVQGIAVARV